MTSRAFEPRDERPSHQKSYHTTRNALAGPAQTYARSRPRPRP